MEYVRLQLTDGTMRLKSITSTNLNFRGQQVNKQINKETNERTN